MPHRDEEDRPSDPVAGEGGAAKPVPEAVERFDRRFVRWMRSRRVLLLRIALGIVFLWFGLLKLVGESPVGPFVEAVAPWVPLTVALVVLGVWETAIAIGLMAWRMPRTTLFLLWALLAGTFLAFLTAPALVFRDGNPFLLTVEGEFVVKNLVLVASGIAVGASVRQPEERGASGRGPSDP